MSIQKIDVTPFCGTQGNVEAATSPTPAQPAAIIVVPDSLARTPLDGLAGREVPLGPWHLDRPMQPCEPRDEPVRLMLKDLIELQQLALR